MEMNMEYIDICSNEKMIKTAIDAVVNYYNKITKLNGGFIYIDKDDVCVVWFCKTLQNYKVILATPLFNSCFYEFSYNGDKKEAYLDVYDKMDKTVINYE